MATQTIGDLLREVTKGSETVFDIESLADPDGNSDGVKVHVGSRQLQPEPPQTPPREESPRRAHKFHDVDGLIAYLQKYATDNTVVLADADNQLMTVVLNEEAEHGFETLQLRPLCHPLFQPWQAHVLGKTRNVLEFAQFVMQHRRVVTDPDGRELAILFSQVTAAKSITLHRGQGKNCINGVVVQTQISGKVMDTPVELPDQITITVPLFVGCDAHPIEIDLLVSERDNSVFVHASSSMVLEAVVTSFLEMVEKIRKELPDVVVSLGEAEHEAWKYLV